MKIRIVVDNMSISNLHKIWEDNKDYCDKQSLMKANKILQMPISIKPSELEIGDKIVGFKINRKSEIFNDSFKNFSFNFENGVIYNENFDGTMNSSKIHFNQQNPYLFIEDVGEGFVEVDSDTLGQLVNKNDFEGIDEIIKFYIIDIGDLIDVYEECKPDLNSQYALLKKGNESYLKQFEEFSANISEGAFLDLVNTQNDTVFGWNLNFYDDSWDTNYNGSINLIVNDKKLKWDYTGNLLDTGNSFPDYINSNFSITNNGLRLNFLSNVSFTRFWDNLQIPGYMVMGGQYIGFNKNPFLISSVTQEMLNEWVINKNYNLLSNKPNLEGIKPSLESFPPGSIRYDANDTNRPVGTKNDGWLWCKKIIFKENIQYALIRSESGKCFFWGNQMGRPDSPNREITNQESKNVFNDIFNILNDSNISPQDRGGRSNLNTTPITNEPWELINSWYADYSGWNCNIRIVNKDNLSNNGNDPNIPKMYVLKFFIDWPLNNTTYKYFLKQPNSSTWSGELDFGV